MKSKKIFIFILFLPSLLLSQITNGSFEKDGNPSLEKWKIQHVGESFQDAPQNSGSWCLRLEAGNYQGAFPNLAYQIIPEIQNGEILKLSAWAKQQLGTTQASIYFGIFHSDGSLTKLSQNKTSSNTWIRLAIQDTIFLNQGDSLAIILDGGITSSPATNWVYFDDLKLQKISTAVKNLIKLNDTTPETFTLLQNYPNPFNSSTKISFNIERTAKIQIGIYNVSGELVDLLINETKSPGLYSIIWETTELSSGVYFILLKADHFLIAKKSMLLR
jgi:hypothetical protein